MVLADHPWINMIMADSEQKAAKNMGLSLKSYSPQLILEKNLRKQIHIKIFNVSTRLIEFPDRLTFASLLKRR